MIEETRPCHVQKEEDIVRYLEHKIAHEPTALDELDAEYKHHLNEKASKVID